MKNLALQRIQEMKPYNPPLAGRREFSGILLDLNEKTISPSSNVRRKLFDLLKLNNLQLYPEYGDLEKKLAKLANVKTEQIMITNGSDQAIDIIFRTFADVNDTVIIPDPSFTMFYQSALSCGNNIIKPLYIKQDMSYPLKEVLSLINDSVKIVVVCNPNNPTGTFISVKEIEIIAKKATNTIIMVDEAYFDFSKITAVPLIKKYPNIIVTRTFSKAFGLPSLRIGYVIASTNNIKELLKVRGPYDVNMIAYTAAIAAIDDLKKIQEYSNEIMKKAKPMIESFFTKNEIEFYKSGGNFLLYRPKVENEKNILEKNGILVRPQDKTNIEGTLRLTIGTVDQMKKFIKVYKEKIINVRNKKYAFIDRDGTLIFEPQDTYQIDSLDKLKILDGVIKGLKLLKKQGYKLVLVSNQDGLGTKSFPTSDFELPQNKMLEVFKKEGIIFDQIFICPHFPTDKCDCRKPKLGLLKNFDLNGIDKDRSFVCGDRKTDQQFAENLDVKFVPMKTNQNFYEALTKEEVV